VTSDNDANDTCRCLGAVVGSSQINCIASLPMSNAVLEIRDAGVG
jgi:hypothetical protein